MARATSAGAGGRLVALAAAAAGALALSAGSPAAPVGVVCTNGPTFDLWATPGYVQTPDGNSILMWSYAPSADGFQEPGPTLCVTEDQIVTVTLHNALGDPAEETSIVFPGQTNVSATGGTPGLFTRNAAPGGTVVYSFRAEEPGTYLYESGTNPHKQIEMGLYGALIVRPAGHPDWAYADSSTQFDPAREYLLLLHDIDPALHAAVEHSQPFDITARHDRYFTINGRSFPDTIADNDAPWLPGQPFGALVQILPDASPSALPALVRYANAGLSNHPVHPHGNHLRVIARDGRLLKGAGGQDTSFEDFTRTIGSGQTYDVQLRWRDAEQWRPDGVPGVTPNPVPVAIPSYRNLAFKDSLTWYSGSPYLGYKGTLPAGVTSNNQCGEYYFPWHSHALNEFVNFNEGFGGMATMLRVEPPGDFAIGATPASRLVAKPGTTTYSVTVSRTNQCFRNSVALSVTGLPAGATAVFSPAALTTGAGTATLTVTVPAATPSGTSTLHVKGTSGASIHEALVNLTVLANAAPSAITIEQGSGAIGSAGSLASSDNVYYQLTSTLVGSTRAASWYATVGGLPAAPVALTLTYEGNLSAARTQTVSIWRWTTSQWVVLDSRSVSTTDVTIADLAPPAPLSSYVGTGANAGQVRIQIRSTGGLTNFTSRGDWLKVSYG